MHFAHAGHNHMQENMSQSIDPLIVIGLAVAVTAIVVAGLMLTMHYLVKRKHPDATRNK